MLGTQFETGPGALMSVEAPEETTNPIAAATGIHLVATTAGKRRGRGCRVCLGEHDAEIHAATLRIRGWFRDQVTMTLKT